MMFNIPIVEGSASGKQLPIGRWTYHSDERWDSGTADGCGLRLGILKSIGSMVQSHGHCGSIVWVKISMGQFGGEVNSDVEVDVDVVDDEDEDDVDDDEDEYRLLYIS